MRDNTRLVSDSISIRGIGATEGLSLPTPVEVDLPALESSFSPCNALTDALREARDDARRITEDGIPIALGSRSSSSIADSRGYARWDMIEVID
jgi:hypothetical protein